MPVGWILPTESDSFTCIFHAELIDVLSTLREAKTKWGYLCIVYSSTRGELSTSCWGSCDKWQSCRFNSSRVSNTCHNSFSLQPSKCWQLQREMRCAIKANLSLYSYVNPTMFNQSRSRMAPGRRDESRGVSIHTERRSVFHQSG